MICCCVVRQRKCEKYWPDKLDEGKMYGNIQVRLAEVEETSDFIIRTFEIIKVRRG